MKKVRTSTRLLFILPAVTWFSVIVILPVLVSVYYSFFDWNGMRSHTADTNWIKRMSPASSRTKMLLSASCFPRIRLKMTLNRMTMVKAIDELGR